MTRCAAHYFSELLAKGHGNHQARLALRISLLCTCRRAGACCESAARRLLFLGAPGKALGRDVYTVPWRCRCGLVFCAEARQVPRAHGDICILFAHASMARNRTHNHALIVIWAHVMQHPVGYEAALDPWLEALFPTLARSGMVAPLAAHKSTANGNSEGTYNGDCIDQPRFVATVEQAQAPITNHSGSSAAGIPAPMSADGNAPQASTEQVFQDACAAAAAFAELSATASGTAAVPAPSNGASNGQAHDGINGVTGTAAATMKQPCWAVVTENRRLTASDHWQVLSGHVHCALAQKTAD